MAEVSTTVKEVKSESLVERIIAKIVKAIGLVSSVFLFSLMAFIFYDVFCRYFFNSPVLGGTELVELLIALTIGLSFSYGQYLKRHIHVEIFYDMIKGRVKTVLDIIIHLICLGVYVLIGYMALLQADYLKGVSMTSQVLLIPAWPFRMVLAIGCFAYCLAIIRDIIGFVRNLIQGKESEGPTEEEKIGAGI